MVSDLHTFYVQIAIYILIFIFTLNFYFTLILHFYRTLTNMKENVNISQLSPTSTSVNENTAYQERKVESINLKKREFKASSNQINKDNSTDDSSMSYQKPSKARKNE